MTSAVWMTPMRLESMAPDKFCLLRELFEATVPGPVRTLLLRLQEALTQLKACYMYYFGDYQFVPGLGPCFPKWSIWQVVFYMYAVTFFIILPLTCWNQRYSIFSSIRRNTADDETLMQLFQQINEANSARVERAESLIDQLGDKNTFSEPHAEKLDQDGKVVEEDRNTTLAVTIITMSRDIYFFGHAFFHPQYLTQVAAKFLKLLNGPEMKNRNYKVAICDVEHRPSRHWEPDQLSEHFVVFPRYKNPKLLARVEQLSRFDRYEKEKQDYVYCLSQTLNYFNPKYVLMVEDDAIPKDEAFDVLHHVLDMRINGDSHAGVTHPRGKEVAYLKLYHPGRLQEYLSFEAERLPELLATGSTLGTFLYSFIKWTSPPFRQRQMKRKIVWCLCALYVMMVVIVVGRPNIQELRRLSKYLYSFLPDPFCCTQAILYPNSSAHKVIDYLNDARCFKEYPKDAALYRFQKDIKLPAYLIQPNLFTHVGMASSLRGNIINPYLFYEEI